MLNLNDIIINKWYGKLTGRSFEYLRFLLRNRFTIKNQRKSRSTVVDQCHLRSI